MNTLTQPPDNPPAGPPGPHVTPYFFRKAVEEAEAWYAGGLTPEPWTA
jgi:hypothetical protein